MALLTIAMVTALAISPQCGAAKPGSALARRLVATAQAESGLDPYTIHINGPNGGARHYATEVDAVVGAIELDGAHVDYDVGLMQINRRQLARHGLTLTAGSAFDPCANMRAGSDHLVDDASSVWDLASRKYNCGRIDCGSAYAERVDALAARVGADSPPAAAPAPAADADDPPPPSWDLEAVADWRRRHFPTPEQAAEAPPPAIAEVITKRE